MANPIQAQELIDLEGYREQIAKTKADYKAWVEDVLNLNDRMQKSALESRNELEKLRRANTGTDDSKAQAQIEQRSTALIQQYRDQKTAIGALTTANVQLEKVTGSLLARQEQLLTQYASIQGTTKKDTDQKKRLANELVNLQNQFDKLDKSTRNSIGSTKEVTGQYNLLQKELTDAKKELKSLDDAFDKNTGALNRNNAAAVALSGRIINAETTLAKFNRTLGTHTRNVGNYPNTVKGLIKTLDELALRFVTIDAVINGAKWFYTQSRDLEAYDKALREVSRSEADFAQSKLYLIGLADKLGVEYTTLIDKYKLLKDATKDTALEGETTQKIFTSITTAGAKMALSNEVIQGTLLAVIQMISKGKVQMEELRQQLGEKVPSAIRLMAAALGVSESKLNKMAEQGELIATEVMPKFAKELGEAYSLKNNEKIEAIGASTARLKNETNLLVEVMNSNKGITAFWDTFTSGVQRGLRSVRLFIQDGSWTELLQFFGPNSLASRTQQRIAKEDAASNFAGLNEGDRYFKLQEYRKKEADQERQGLVEEAQKTREIRRKLEDLDRRANVEAMKQKRRAEGLAEKDAVSKNEDDLERFQKQSARKRAAELIALEGQLAKEKNNSELVAKLDAYNKLDIELRTKEKAVTDRIKEQSGKAAAEREREKDKKLQDNIAYNRQSTDKKVAGLDAAHEQGGMNEGAYLNQRLTLLQDGVLKEQELLRRVNKEKTAEYEATEKELSEIAAWYLNERNNVQEKAFKAAVDAVGKLIEADSGKLKSVLSQRLADLQIAYDNEATAIKKSVTNRQLSEGEGEQRLADLKIKLLEDVARATAANADAIEQMSQSRLDTLTEQLKSEGKSQVDIDKALADERVKIINEHNDAIKKGADLEVEINKEKNSKIEKNDEDSRKKRDAIIEKAAEVAIASVSGYTDLVNSFRDQELARIEKNKANELVLVGDNAEAKTAIETKYAAQEKAIKKRQAMADKEAAIFQIGINTAVSASKVLSNPFLLALTLALGAIQIAVVASKPIPEYFKGSPDVPESGAAWVGERGYELVESPNKGGKPSYRFFANKQLAYLNKHDRVYTHQETKRIFERHADVRNMRYTAEVNQSLAREVRTASGGSQHQVPVIYAGISKEDMRQVMNEAFAAQTIEQTILSDGELKRYILKKQQRTELKNKYFSLPKKGDKS